MRDVILILHDVRSTYNVGSLLRTAEGLGVKIVYFSGYTPYPETAGDKRLPHISGKLTRQIHKTALGAELLIAWKPQPDIFKLIKKLNRQSYLIVALEQNEKSILLEQFKPDQQLALIVGNETSGLTQEVLGVCDKIIEIPMKGSKESFNVVQAAAIALYRLTAD